MFPIRLRELREAAGYKSQQAFAKAFGVAQSTVGNWEAGKREPNYETTIRLAEFLNTSIDYLLGRSSDPASTGGPSLNPGEAALLRAYRAATPADRAIIDNIVGRYTDDTKSQRLA